MVNEAKVSAEAFPAASVTVITNPPLLVPATQVLSPLLGIIARVFDPEPMLVVLDVASPLKDAVPASSLVSTKANDASPAALAVNGFPAGETCVKLGAVVSIVKAVIASVFEAFPAGSVTMIVPLYVPATRAVRVIVFAPTFAASVRDVTPPPYVIAPA